MKPLTAQQVPPKVVVTQEYTAEIRFGIVMYGGVSLAIYINGVAHELFQMACATPRDGIRVHPDPGPGTQQIYERLSRLVGNRGLIEDYANTIRADQTRVGRDGERTDVWDEARYADRPRTRLVIDVISGTSAGGINGIFLGKALANGQNYGNLKQLWVHEGDFSLLLNDDRSRADTVPKLPHVRSPASLLNSDRMYVSLRSALSDMGPITVEPKPKPPHASPLVDELDLFITTTDIVGTKVPLRLFDKVVFEKRHKQNFHFRYPSELSKDGNDFSDLNNPFLAFAARCTSSFPFAFEPMTLNRISYLQPDGHKLDIHSWRDFFGGLREDEVRGDAYLHRAFGDGGYLDNAPFSYVVETLARRFSTIPIERKLLYVEPSPKQVALPTPQAGKAPDAISNSLAALLTIPQYETIREDLEQVLSRNRRIERIERIVRRGELNLEQGDDTLSGACGDSDGERAWASLTMSKLARLYGLAFLPYVRLREVAVTDTLADRLGAHWGIDSRSDRQYALRTLVRVWRMKHFDDDGALPGTRTTNAFLAEFDFDYRIRRLGFLMRKTDQLLRLFQNRRSNADRVADEADQSLLRRLLIMGNELLNNLAGPAPAPATLAMALAALRALKAELVDVRTSLLAAQHQRGFASTVETGDARHTELIYLLDLLLDPVNIHEPRKLADIHGAEGVAVDLERVRDAAAGARTLHESVLARANAIFSLASGAPTAIQMALEADVEWMRIRPAEAASATGLHEISERVWMVLGYPKRGAGLRTVVVEPTRAADCKCDPDGSALAALNSPVGSALRSMIGHYYLTFECYDQASFPLYYDTGTGEPATVEIVRVSPGDACNLIDESKDSRRKLAGTALANFGAFLDRRWRLNDAMWGRLDGAERLVQVLLPGSDPESVDVRKELTELAQGRILREELILAGHGDLTDILCKALEELQGRNIDERLRILLTQLSLGNTQARESMRRLLHSLISEKGLLEFVRKSRDFDPDPDPRTTMQSTARAVTITGRMLDAISSGRDLETTLPRWLARFGLFLQGVVAVSVPGALRQRWWSHSVKLLYAFEFVALGFVLLLGNAESRQMVIAAIVLTGAVHLLTLIVRDYIRDRKSWLKALLGAIGLALLALAGVGTWTLATGKAPALGAGFSACDLLPGALLDRARQCPSRP